MAVPPMRLTLKSLRPTWIALLTLAAMSTTAKGAFDRHVYSVDMFKLVHAATEVEVNINALNTNLAKLNKLAKRQNALIMRQQSLIAKAHYDMLNMTDVIRDLGHVETGRVAFSWANKEWHQVSQNEIWMPVTFEKPYARVPVVKVGLFGADVERVTRYTVEARRIHRRGFWLYLKQWGNTEWQYGKFSWLSMPSMK